MKRRNLWLRRKSVRFRFAEDQEKRVSAAYACLRWIVNLGVFITVLAQLLDTLCCAGAQIIKSTKDNRLGWAKFCACGYEPTFLAIITKRAFECAAGIREWFADDDRSRRTDTRRRNNRSRCKHRSAPARNRFRCEQLRRSDTLRGNRLLRNACKRLKEKPTET